MTKEQKMLVKNAIENGDLAAKTEKELEKEFMEYLNSAYDPIVLLGLPYDYGEVLKEVDPVSFRQALLEYIVDGYVEDPNHIWGENCLYLRQADLDEFLATHELLKSLKDTPAT